MAELSTYFKDFLQQIRLTEAQKEELKEGHKTLRERLEKDEQLSPILVSTFLQGSYRRSTIVRPLTKEEKPDVDVIVVTNLDRHTVEAQEALDKFRPFLKKHYDGSFKMQGRSIGIELETVKLDLVPTSAPSEVMQGALRSLAAITSDTVEEAPDWRFNQFWLSLEERDRRMGGQSWLFRAAREAEWKAEPLWIPDRDAGAWEETNPLEQIRWTIEKNNNTGGHYVNVVKALKWWWLRLHEPETKRPKGYPFEHIVGDQCADGIGSVADGVVRTLESIVNQYRVDRVIEQVPESEDRGTSENVLKRITPEEFCEFYDEAGSAAAIARQAYESSEVAESAELWKRLFGAEFRDPPEGGSRSGSGGGSAAAGGFVEPVAPAGTSGGRFA